MIAVLYFRKDGAIYFLTNNTDGRGIPRQGDDKIYRIIPKRQG
jgi:hypothetical protein